MTWFHPCGGAVLPRSISQMELRQVTFKTDSSTKPLGCCPSSGVTFRPAPGGWNVRAPQGLPASGIVRELFALSVLVRSLTGHKNTANSKPRMSLGSVSKLWRGKCVSGFKESEQGSARLGAALLPSSTDMERSMATSSRRCFQRSLRLKLSVYERK